MRVDFLNEKPVDQDGNWSPAWRNNMQLLMIQINQILSIQGIQTPQIPATTISQLTNVNNAGAFMYDIDNHLFKGNVNGVIKTFPLT